MVEITNFTTEEIMIMQRYIEANVPNTTLSKIFVLSENIEDKIPVFVIVYRILNSAKNYCISGETKNKMIELLEESNEIYNLIYPSFLEYYSGVVNYGKSKLRNKMVDLLTEKKYLKNMNKLIDAFLIFGEKIELIDLEKAAGLDLEVDQGKQIYEEMQNKGIL